MFEGVKDVVAVVLSVVGGLGGLELIKWFFNRKANGRLASAKAEMAEIEAEMAEIEAETAEFRLLRERLEMSDRQLLEKEKRFQEQTELVRDLNRQLLEAVSKAGMLQSRVSALEAERKMKLCEIRGCGEREPQSGY